MNYRYLFIVHNIYNSWYLTVITTREDKEDIICDLYDTDTENTFHLYSVDAYCCKFSM